MTTNLNSANHIYQVFSCCILNKSIEIMWNVCQLSSCSTERTKFIKIINGFTDSEASNILIFHWILTFSNFVFLSWRSQNSLFACRSVLELQNKTWPWHKDFSFHFWTTNLYAGGVENRLGPPQKVHAVVMLGRKEVMLSMLWIQYMKVDLPWLTDLL